METRYKGYNSEVIVLEHQQGIALSVRKGDETHTCWLIRAQVIDLAHDLLRRAGCDVPERE